MQFMQHGSYDIWCEGNILYAVLEGTWNQEAAENYERDFMELADTLPKPWGHIVYLNDWELCSADMFPIIRRLVDWCIENKLTSAANVFSPSHIKEDFMNKMVAEEQGDFQRVVFDNEADAINWLKTQGFNAEPLSTFRK